MHGWRSTTGVVGAVGGVRQEGQRCALGDARRGARVGAPLRVDRRADSLGGREDVPAALHPPAARRASGRRSTAPPWSGFSPREGSRLRAFGRWTPPGKMAAGPRLTIHLETSRCRTILPPSSGSVPAARRFFEQLDSRNRYAILYRLFDAKRPETRQRRLEQFVRHAGRREDAPLTAPIPDANQEIA